MKVSYNLIDEPWITCRMPDGGPREFGLCEVLGQAHTIEEIQAQTPLVAVSLLRLLVGLVHRIQGGPATVGEWGAMWDRGHFDLAGVEGYLSSWRHRFDLFDKEFPFMQVGGFHIVDGSGSPKAPATTALLAHEAATGNNATLFDHACDESPVLLPAAQAARRLVAHQFYAIGGGKGGTSDRFGEHPYLSSGPLVGGVVLVPIGRTLFHTIMLNLILPGFHKVSATNDDAPSWEWEHFPAPGKWQAGGYLSQLTYPSRYCRLMRPAEASASTPQTAVTGVYTAQALTPDNAVVSPWMASRQLKDGSVVPVAMRVDRLLWRDAHVFFSQPRIAGSRLDGRPAVIRQLELLLTRVDDVSAVAIDAFGLANDKAKLLAWRRESFRLPAAMLEDEELRHLLDEAVQRAEEIGTHVVSTLKPLAKVALFNDAGYRATGREHDRLVSAIEPNPFWGRMNDPFRTLLHHLPDNTLEALAAWEKKCAEEALASLRQLITRLSGPRAAFIKEEARAENLFHAWIRQTNRYQT